MAFQSILFKNAQDSENIQTKPPAFFADLNLDQVIDAVTASKLEYDIKPFFYTSLHDIDAVHYRHEVMRDLEDGALMEDIKSFAHKMHVMRQSLDQIENLYYIHQKERWLLDAAALYCEAVRQLLKDLSESNIRSRGLLAFREYLSGYCATDGFTALASQAAELLEELSEIKYCIHIKAGGISVRKYMGESDLSAEVEDTFSRFRQGGVKNYRVTFPENNGMNDIEGAILKRVSRLYPAVFRKLDAFCEKYAIFTDGAVLLFDREIQFYVAYLDFIDKFMRAGLSFCYPQLSKTDKEIHNSEGFDLALANKLIDGHSKVVCNDFFMEGKERIFIVSGPNQGGKTTFARAFGQMHFLASLGCPVPGREARLFLFDKLFTHFEKEENIKNLRGRLMDDLVRFRDIQAGATPDSIVIINEIFASTTFRDAVALGRKIMKTLADLDLLCVFVTFIDELAEVSEKAVSMTSTVEPGNPARRTYKIVRRRADGLAYAMTIAEKYRLTYESLKERIRS